MEVDIRISRALKAEKASASPAGSSPVPSSKTPPASPSPYNSPSPSHAMPVAPLQPQSALFLKEESAVGPPEIDPKEIEYNEARDFLGQGSFGKVYVGKKK